MFYYGGLATEKCTFQWVADDWHRDKTTQPIDFYLLKDLTLHSYWAGIIAIMKQWVERVEPTLKLHDHKALKLWFLKITLAQ